MSHFQGKGATQHILEAREKGREATAETHGVELPGHYSAALDAAKETALLLLLLALLFPISLLSFSLFLLAWLIGKTGRSAHLGWSRLERLHRLIEEERWEIEHHRAQEKDELKAIYTLKGFSGILLDEVVNVLMADDNRLLQVMLEEELGLSLETYEHPLKQAAGAALGVIVASLCVGGALAISLPAALATGAMLISLSALGAARFEKNRSLSAIVWSLAVAALALGSLYFALQIP